MKKTHDLVATIGKYKDRDGNEKKRFQNVGSVFVDDQGRESIKLDCVPVGPEWSGWLSKYPIDREQSPRPRQQSREVPPDDGDQIPF